MSGIAGIYHFETKPIDPWQLTVLSQALAERGPDGGNEIITERVGMAYRAFHTNAESRREHQPLVSVWGHTLCWDGRLDNRDELLALFANDCDRTDAGLILAAYQKWGADFLSRIIGDFALSLWILPFRHSSWRAILSACGGSITTETMTGCSGLQR